MDVCWVQPLKCSQYSLAPDIISRLPVSLTQFKCRQEPAAGDSDANLSTSSTWQRTLITTHLDVFICHNQRIYPNERSKSSSAYHHHQSPRHWPLISQHPPLCESTCPPWSLPSCVDYWLGSCLCNVHHPHLSPESGLHIISAWENFNTSSAVFITNHLWYWLEGLRSPGRQVHRDAG